MRMSEVSRRLLVATRTSSLRSKHVPSERTRGKGAVWPCANYPAAS